MRLAARFGRPLLVGRSTPASAATASCTTARARTCSRASTATCSTRPASRDIVLLEGINDIGWGDRPDNLASADEIIAAYRQLILRAHARGLKIYAGHADAVRGRGLLLGFGRGEATAVNDWIRHSGAFDGVIEFEPAVWDPAHPIRYLGAAEHGDHLHPSDEGYRRMAEAVSLKPFEVCD